MVRFPSSPPAAAVAAATIVGASAVVALVPGRAGVAIATLLLVSIPITTERLRQRMEELRSRLSLHATLLAGCILAGCLLLAGDFAAFAPMVPIFGAAGAYPALAPRRRAGGCA